MIITCPECQSQYRLEPSVLKPDGRQVRCTTCLHVWHQAPIAQQKIEDVLDSGQDEIEHMHAEPDGDSLIPDLAFEESDDAQDAQNEDADDDEEGDASFATLLNDAQKNETQEEDIPEGVKPVPADFTPPTRVTFKAMSMTAEQMGLLTFLFCMFATLIVLFSFKPTIIRTAPAMAGFYKTLGLPVVMPGAGLKLAEMTATKDKDIVTLRTTLSNISETQKKIPAFSITVKNAYATEVGQWHKTVSEKVLASGEKLGLEFVLEGVSGEAHDIMIKATM